MRAESMADIVERAHRLMAGGRRWCRNYLALDVRGYPVQPEQMDAHSFCLIGAIFRESPSREDGKAVCTHLRDWLWHQKGRPHVNLDVLNNSAETFEDVRGPCQAYVEWVRAST